MKNYLVIGNPIDHSLSPELHNFWIKNANINAIYEKKKTDKSELQKIVNDIRKGELAGVNVTVPYKEEIIKFLDVLSPEAKKTKSVNTIYKKDNKIIGHNTDIGGFDLAIRHIGFKLKDKKILILGAGGVVPSIICALKDSRVSKINLMNRTKSKAEKLKSFFGDIKILDWGDNCSFDMIINATSLGLKKTDDVKLDFYKVKEKKLFYDVIYNPRETNFLKKARENSHQTENGKMMFIYQAHQAFTLWHGLMPKIDNKVIGILK